MNLDGRCAGETTDTFGHFESFDRQKCVLVSRHSWRKRVRFGMKSA
jgi:hypothetical protein